MESLSNLVTGTTLHRRLQTVIDKVADGGYPSTPDPAMWAMALDLSRAEARMHERLARRARKAARSLSTRFVNGGTSRADH